MLYVAIWYVPIRPVLMTTGRIETYQIATAHERS